MTTANTTYTPYTNGIPKGGFTIHATIDSTWSQRYRKNRTQVYSCVKQRDNPPQSNAFACIVNPPLATKYQLLVRVEPLIVIL